MTTPQMFKGIGTGGSTAVKAPISFHWPSFLGKLVAAVVIIAILLYVGFQLFGFITKVATNWNEIQFAYEKPAVVHAVRVQYDSKAVALDSQFTAGKPSEQDQVLKQIEAVLQSTPSK